MKLDPQAVTPGVRQGPPLLEEAATGATFSRATGITQAQVLNLCIRFYFNVSRKIFITVLVMREQVSPYILS